MFSDISNSVRGQHDALRGVAVDQIEDARYVAHAALRTVRSSGGAAALHQAIGVQAADHDVILVAERFAGQHALQHGAGAAARDAHLAHALPEGRRGRIQLGLHAAGGDSVGDEPFGLGGRELRADLLVAPSSTPSTSVRKIRLSAPKPAAQATAIWSAFTL